MNTEEEFSLVAYALLLILPFSVFPLFAHTRLVRDLFLMLHCLSGTVSLVKLHHQTHSHLSSNLSNLTSSSHPVNCVCAYTCLVIILF